MRRSYNRQRIVCAQGALITSARLIAIIINVIINVREQLKVLRSSRLLLAAAISSRAQKRSLSSNASIEPLAEFGTRARAKFDVISPNLNSADRHVIAFCSQSFRLVRERKRIAWILLLLAVLFALCWLPFNVLRLLIDLGAVGECELAKISLRGA